MHKTVYLKWFYFLSKRLYKKWMFILLVCLVPLSVLTLKITASQKSGFVQVGVVNLSGDTGDKIIENLNSGKKIINYKFYEKREPALSDLEADRLDTVWVLPEKIEKRIANFVNNPDGDNYIIEVFKKEDSLKTRLALEKLSGAVYPFTSRPFFLKCVREETDFDFKNLTDEEILKYYDDYFNNGNLFRFAFPDGDTLAKQNEQNYLTSPVRGLLSAVVLLSGLAGAMLYVSDEKRGVFSFAKSRDKMLISLASVFTSVINIGIMVFCSIFILSVNTDFGREICISSLFVVNTVLFCGILCTFLKSVAVMAPTTVLITVADVFICPIFFDFYVQKTPQLFLPNTYYINSVHSNLYFKYSVVYALVLLLITLLLYIKKSRE